jgi:hypothetical protein
MATSCQSSDKMPKPHYRSRNMFNEKYLAFVGIFVTLFAAFSAMGGAIARNKRRPPMEGVLLGMFLGPIGVVLELRASYNHRPLVDRNSQSSLHKLLSYQENLEKPVQPKAGEV